MEPLSSNVSGSLPFTTLHAEGIASIFPDSAQVDSLLDLLNNLNLTAA